jgi:hypothetical protein
MELVYRIMKDDNSLKDVSSPINSLRWANDMVYYLVNSVCSNFSEYLNQLHFSNNAVARFLSDLSSKISHVE